MNPTLAKLNKGRRRLTYFAGNFINYFLPDALYRKALMLRFKALSPAQKREAQERADYYVRLDGKRQATNPRPLVKQTEATLRVADFKFPFRAKKRLSLYFFDLFRIVRCFDRDLMMSYIFGDADYHSACKAFVKTRPIVGEDEFSLSVLMPLNGLHHFRWVNDSKPWREKKDMMMFRNVVDGKPHREEFLKKSFHLPICDSGDVSKNPPLPQYAKPYMSIQEQLDYKFICCIEGNDVATNLKWVMSSNSIAVMPRPKFESWYMEGQLKPGVHYIEIADDYSDIEERLTWYINHPEEAEAIIRNANEYTRRFRNTTLERYTAYLTAQRYFEHS